jgi:hypothetical protein
VVATSPWVRLLRRVLARRPHHAVRASRLLGRTVVVGGALVAGAGVVHAVDLPEDRAEMMYHRYDGGGTRADGPALLIRKKVADRLSLTGSYFIDSVSNASIDVVTTASPYKEKRTEYSLGADYVYRDAMVSVSGTTSDEPDYKANTVSLDVSQEVFGGMTTVALGFSRGADKVGSRYQGFFDTAQHWRYRFGVTQILTPRWLMSVNLEAVSDNGYLGNPYRVAQVFGTTVLERYPRTRSSRAVKLRAVGDIGQGEQRAAIRGEYRYFWDNWDIKAHTVELGYTRYFGAQWLGEAFVRYNTQKQALFYSDNALSETLYVSRNKQLSDFNDVSIGAKGTYSVGRYADRFDVKLNAQYQFMRFRYKNFTDIRNGSLYSFDANVLELFVSATF